MIPRSASGISAAWPGARVALLPAMRVLAMAWVLAGCGIGLETDNRPQPYREEPVEDPCANSGGLPTPACGSGARCQCCVGCDLASGTCIGLDTWFWAGVGECTTRSQGTLTMDVAGIPFAATEVAAVATSTTLQVSGTAGNRHTIAIKLPARLGTFDCTADWMGMFAYFDSELEYWNRTTTGRPACSVTLTAIGDVGALIEGTFSATVVGPTTIDLTNGAFSVVRAAYP